MHQLHIIFGLLALNFAGEVASLENEISVWSCGLCSCKKSEYRLGIFANCSRKSLIRLPQHVSRDVSELDLSYNKLDTVSFTNASMCERFPFLRSLSLSWNDIGFEKDVFLGCYKLVELDIRGNDLKSVTATTFQSLSSLKKLALSTGTVEGKAFEKLSQLRDIAFLEAQTFHTSAFLGLDKLLSLKLVYHGYDIDTNLFGDLKGLRNLSLSVTLIRSLPLGIFQLPRLEKFELFGPKIRTMSASIFSGLPELRSLFLDFPSLVEFKLNREDKPHNLTELEIHNVREVDGDLLHGLQLLKNLSLQGINTSPDGISFDRSPSLKSLSIVDCSLRELPDRWFSSLGDLESLELTNNSLHHVQVSAFDGLTSLKDLKMAHNKISELPAGVFTPLMPTLRLLVLRANQLVTIKDRIFGGMTQLRGLDLSRNHLEWLHPNAFLNLPGLYSLDLHYNALNVLDVDIFRNLRDLNNLDLSENQLTEFPMAVLPTSVAVLNLKGNAIKSLPSPSLCNMENIHDFSVEENPIECDCGVKDLVECMRERQGVIHGDCYLPHFVRGMKIEQVTECMPEITTESIVLPSSSTTLEAADPIAMKATVQYTTTDKNAPSNALIAAVESELGDKEVSRDLVVLKPQENKAATFPLHHNGKHGTKKAESRNGTMQDPFTQGIEKVESRNETVQDSTEKGIQIAETEQDLSEDQNVTKIDEKSVSETTQAVDKYDAKTAGNNVIEEDSDSEKSGGKNLSQMNKNNYSSVESGQNNIQEAAIPFKLPHDQTAEININFEDLTSNSNDAHEHPEKDDVEETVNEGLNRAEDGKSAEINSSRTISTQGFLSKLRNANTENTTVTSGPPSQTSLDSRTELTETKEQKQTHENMDKNETSMFNTTWSNETLFDGPHFANISDALINETGEVEGMLDVGKQEEAAQNVEKSQAGYNDHSSTILAAGVIISMVTLISLVVGIYLYMRNRHTGYYNAIDAPTFHSGGSVVDIEMDTILNSARSEPQSFHMFEPGHKSSNATKENN